MSPLTRWLLPVPAHLFHWRAAWLLRHRFLLLIHLGRRTGRRHETVLEVMEYRPTPPEAVVMSAWGRRANWLRNIETTPGPEVLIGRQRFTAAHRFLSADEAVAVVRGYERRNRLVAPLIRIVLSRFLGWRYHSSDSERRRLVAQLPLIAFRPR